tara:strand:+ start:578 stop:685 length:108 start_codon:yes stop_codon:yes gene_type:complete
MQILDMAPSPIFIEIRDEIRDTGAIIFQTADPSKF